MMNDFNRGYEKGRKDALFELREEIKEMDAYYDEHSHKSVFKGNSWIKRDKVLKAIDSRRTA